MVADALRATAAELRLGTAIQRGWFAERGSRMELASFLTEGDWTPSLREELSTAAGIPEDSAAESASASGSPFGTATDVKCPTAGEVPFRERLWQARPVAGIELPVDWSRLVDAHSTESLDEHEQLDQIPEPQLVGGKKRRPKAIQMDINSGGQVFFGILAPREGQCEEEAVVIKFCNSRHMLQSEQMAAEFAWHLEIAAPMSRLLLKVHDSEEWQELSVAAQRTCTSLADTLGKKQSMLVMQYVRGHTMQKEKGAWQPGHLTASARALGRLFVLDMLLGNADRLPIKALMWRGNPSNVIWSSSMPGGADDGTVSSQCIPIDAQVARRPPKMLVQEADNNADMLLELTLLERATAQQVLLDAVSHNEAAVAAIEADWEPSEPAWVAKNRPPPRDDDAEKVADDGDKPVAAAASAAPQHSAVKAFHEGVKTGLELALRELGLLEMVADVIRSWLDNFCGDMGENFTVRSNLSKTRQFKDWDRKAEENDAVRDRVSSWQALLQEKSLVLREAADDWANRRGLQTAVSFRGFIGNSVLNPIADAYELLVRLQQLIARAKVMANASLITRPSDLSPAPLFVGPVTACCYHLLRKLGVTLVLNCTTDLPPPPDSVLSQNFKWHRLALQDTEDQELLSSLEEGLCVIDEAVSAGGRVFVHCHEGKSRSVSLCLAYLITREKRPLAEALAFVKQRRPIARPNRGFMKQLLDLELTTLGSNSMTVDELPKGKPKLMAKPSLSSGARRLQKPAKTSPALSGPSSSQAQQEPSEAAPAS